MRQHLLKAAALLMAALLGIMALTGCVSKLPEDESVVAVFQGENISKTEAALYVYTMQYDTEKGNDYVIASLFGSYETFWEQETDGVTYSVNCAKDAIAALFQTRILNLKAKSSGITLTAEEEKKVQEGIAAYKEEYAKVIEKAGADDALVERFVRENAIANKVYLSIIADADDEIDTESCRRKIYEGLMIYGKSYLDDDEDKVEYTEEDLTAAREAALSDIEAALKSGMTVDEIAELYIDDDILSVTAFSDNVADTSFAQKEGEEFTSYKHLVWSLSTGEVGSIITKNSVDKYVGYVVKCTDDDNAEERAAAEAEERQELINTCFEKAYKKLAAKYDSFIVREEAMEKFDIEPGLYENEYMSTDESAEETE